jgi:hypothetical protein
MYKHNNPALLEIIKYKEQNARDDKKEKNDKQDMRDKQDKQIIISKF